MKAYKILGIGAMSLAALVGCTTTQREEPAQPQKLEQEVARAESVRVYATPPPTVSENVLDGKPLGVFEVYGRHSGTVAIVIASGERETLANINCNNLYDCANAGALIQTEVSKVSGRVNLFGTMEKDGVFQVQSLKAGSYSIKFQ